MTARAIRRGGLNETPLTHEQIADWVHDARQRTCELVADLTDEQLLGPLDA